MDLRELLDRLLAVFFPKRCGFCQEVVEYDDYWCGRCELPRAIPHSPMEADEAHAITLAVSPFVYREPLRSRIIHLKEHKDPRLVRFFAFEMTGAWTKEAGAQPIDLIVPVPQTKAKQQSIGFNHAALLAEAIGKILERPVREDLLRRVPSSREQHELNMQQRIENARASYHGAENQVLSGEHVLLVDDVLTTGATLAACASCLLRMGAQTVCAVSAVRVERL